MSSRWYVPINRYKKCPAFPNMCVPHMEAIPCYIWTMKKKTSTSRRPDWQLFLYFPAGLDTRYRSIQLTDLLHHIYYPLNRNRSVAWWDTLARSYIHFPSRRQTLISTAIYMLTDIIFIYEKNFWYWMVPI